MILYVLWRMRYLSNNIAFIHPPRLVNNRAIVHWIRARYMNKTTVRCVGHSNIPLRVYECFNIFSISFKPMWNWGACAFSDWICQYSSIFCNKWSQLVNFLVNWNPAIVSIVVKCNLLRCIVFNHVFAEVRKYIDLNRYARKLTQCWIVSTLLEFTAHNEIDMQIIGSWGIAPDPQCHNLFCLNWRIKEISIFIKSETVAFLWAQFLLKMK